MKIYGSDTDIANRGERYLRTYPTESGKLQAHEVIDPKLDIYMWRTISFLKDPALEYNQVYHIQTLLHQAQLYLLGKARNCFGMVIRATWLMVLMN